MRYLKFITGLVGSAALWVAVYVADHGHIDTVGWVQLAVGVTGALTVWLAANVPSLPIAKTVGHALALTLSLVATLLLRDGHLTSADVAQLVIMFLTTLGVYALPNAP